MASQFPRPRDRRTEPRWRRRLSLRFERYGITHSAFSYDVGPHGLFVRTGLVLPPGACLDIHVDVPDIGQLELRSVIAWARRVPPSLQRLLTAGFGAQVVQPPRGWMHFIESHTLTPRPSAIRVVGV
jgi:hypothetical protein